MAGHPRDFPTSCGQLESHAALGGPQSPGLHSCLLSGWATQGSSHLDDTAPSWASIQAVKLEGFILRIGHRVEVAIPISNVR